MNFYLTNLGAAVGIGSEFDSIWGQWETQDMLLFKFTVFLAILKGHLLSLHCIPDLIGFSSQGRSAWCPVELVGGST